MDKNKIRIRVDMDEVLNTLSDYWLEMHYEQTGEKLVATEFYMDNVSKYGKDIYSYFSEPNFFYNAPPRDGLSDFFYFMDSNLNYIDYRIVSSSFTDDKNMRKYLYDQKYQWLYDHVGEHVADRLILTGDSKKGYPADIIIDDHINHIKDSPKRALKILFKATHNMRENKSDYDSRTLLGIGTLSGVKEVIRDVIYKGSVDNYFEDN